MQIAEYHINVADQDCLATPLLTEVSGLSTNQVKQAMTKGAVWLTDRTGTHRLRRAKKTLSSGNILHFYFNADLLQAKIPAPTLVADEGDYSVWVKPRGVLSQGSKWADHCSIARWIEIHDVKQRPAFIVHRLDRAATGLILIAHSKRSSRLLADLFQQRAIDKTYQAVVNGQFAEDDREYLLDSDIDQKPACSRVHQLAFDPDSHQSLLEVRIETGRKHQIRKHLSERGFAIVGDRLYGGGDRADLQLAAVSLSFLCPLSGDQRRYLLSEPLRPHLTRQ